MAATDREALRRERDRLIALHGPWEDRLPLGHDLYTGERTVGAAKGEAVLQGVADAVGDLSGASVIDLGAADGLYAVEFAVHAKRVVAVEGRLGNVEKARFVKRALDLENLEVHHQDVRELDTSEPFDVVLCLGLLYHLEGAAGVKLCHDLAKITGRVALVETHITDRPNHTIEVAGKRYRGRLVREFDPDASTEEQEELSRSGLRNSDAFWFSRSSLLNLLADAGFTSVSEMRVPHYGSWNDRVALLCFSGEPRRLKVIEGAKTVPWAEGEDHGPHPSDTWQADVKRRIGPYVPYAVKRIVRARRERAFDAYFRVRR